MMKDRFISFWATGEFLKMIQFCVPDDYYLWELHLLGGSMPGVINKILFKSIYFKGKKNTGVFPKY